jgi:predicted metal-binding protein
MIGESMGPDLGQEIAKLIELAAREGADAKEVSPSEVIVADWVGFKCAWGCKGYGKHLSCPPYAPSPEETRRMLSEYRSALLLRFDGVPGMARINPDQIPEDFHPMYKNLILWVHDTVHKLEKTAFYDGFYKAFGFGAYPCIYCEHCVAEESSGPVDRSMKRLCRHMDKVRPSMEAAGMDVFATVEKAGWELSTIPCKDMEYGKIVHAKIVSFGLVLID